MMLTKNFVSLDCKKCNSTAKVGQIVEEKYFLKYLDILRRQQYPMPSEAVVKIVIIAFSKQVEGDEQRSLRERTTITLVVLRIIRKQRSREQVNCVNILITSDDFQLQTHLILFTSYIMLAD